MILGEIIVVKGEIEFNVGFLVVMIDVLNVGDWLVQVGLYYYFYEINLGFKFDCEKVCGLWFDILVGIVVCFELGQMCSVNLIFMEGNWEIYGFCQDVMGRF